MMEETDSDISTIQSNFVTIITKINQFSYGSQDSVNLTEILLSEMKTFMSLHSKQSIVQVFGTRFVKIV